MHAVHHMESRGPRPRLAVLALALAVLLWTGSPVAAGALQERFGAFDTNAAQTADHSAWDALLKEYVTTDGEGLNRVDYARWKEQGHAALKDYVAALQRVEVTKLARAEQFAFWTNLYNARTIDIVLEGYPVESIRDIRLSGFLIPGPWREKVVRVEGVELSLDDIEHEILRALWKEPRVHYAVNCASVGCPNLPRAAFTGAKLEAMLEEGARAYINSPRGARISDGGLSVSSIYHWFAGDFGGSPEGVLAHLRRYAQPPLAKALAGVSEIAGHDYDWTLNDTKN